MISFITQGQGGARDVSGRLSSNCPDCYDEIFEIVSSFSDIDENECEFGFALFGRLLLVRIYDGEVYSFVYPIALSDGQDEREALTEIGRYAVREEIPLVFCDVPYECIETVEGLFRFTKTYRDGESCVIEVLNELMCAEDIPHLSDGVVTLSPLSAEDIPDYARLCRDAQLNKYWGYDVHADMPYAPDEYFYQAAERCAEEGTALSLAVRADGEFAGEAVLWGFDLHGSAELAFRILPRLQNRTYGKRTLSLLLKLGDELGLFEMRASVMQENIPSVKLLDRQMECCYTDKNVKRYLQKY